MPGLVLGCPSAASYLPGLSSGTPWACLLRRAAGVPRRTLLLLSFLLPKGNLARAPGAAHTLLAAAGAGSLTPWCPAGVSRIRAAGARCRCLRLERVKPSPRWVGRQRAATYPDPPDPGSRSSEQCSTAGAPRAAWRTCSRRPEWRPRSRSRRSRGGGGVPAPPTPPAGLAQGCICRASRSPLPVRGGGSGRWGQPGLTPGGRRRGGAGAGGDGGRPPAPPRPRPPAAVARAAAGRAGACEPASQ